MITTGSAAGGGQVSLGIVVAVCSVALYDLGYVLEKQALAELPPLSRRTASMLVAVARSPRWVAGFVAMLSGLGLQVVALTLAPVSVVQPLLAAGVLGVVVAGRTVLGERLGRRDWLAVVLVLAGVVTIALSAGSGARLARTVPGGRFSAMVGVVVALAVAARVLASRGARRGWSGRRDAVALSVAAGLLYGVGALSEKAIATGLVGHGVVRGAATALGTAYPWTFVVATFAGMVVFERGLQRQPASLMVPLANVMSGVCALAGASIVFGELFVPSGWWSLPRWFGLAAVLAAMVALVGDDERSGAPALA